MIIKFIIITLEYKQDVYGNIIITFRFAEKDDFIK